MSLGYKEERNCLSLPGYGKRNDERIGIKEIWVWNT
jgi:hypothetical protein